MGLQIEIIDQTSNAFPIPTIFKELPGVLF